MTIRSFVLSTEHPGFEQQFSLGVHIDVDCPITRRAIIDGVGVYNSTLADGDDFEKILEYYCKLLGTRLVFRSLFDGNSLHNVKALLDNEEGFFEIFTKDNVKIEFAFLRLPILEEIEIEIREVKP